MEESRGSRKFSGLFIYCTWHHNEVEPESKQSYALINCLLAGSHAPAGLTSALS